MIKKLIIMGILMIPFLLLTRMATAQTYQDMPADVRAQMDINKLNGASQWTNIHMVYEVTATGLDAEENKILLERAKADKSVVETYFNASGNVVVVCVGGTPFDNVKYIFAQIVSGITNIKTSGSLIKADKK